MRGGGAIECHIEGKYGDDSSTATWARRLVASETRAATLDGIAGAPLCITDDDTLVSAPALGRRLGKVPGPDGFHCEVLQLVSLWEARPLPA